MIGDKSFVILRNVEKNISIKATVGYSYTFLMSLFLSAFIVPLYRKDYKLFAVLFLYNLCMLFLANLATTGASSYIAPTMIIYYVSALILTFVYNKMYISSLIKQGYKIIHHSKDLDEKKLQGLSSIPLDSVIDIQPTDEVEKTKVTIKHQRARRIIITSAITVAIWFAFALFIPA